MEEGELLPDEDIQAFWDDFEGSFGGYYDTMPESLRELTESFTERVNERYAMEVGRGIPISTVYAWVSEESDIYRKEGEVISSRRGVVFSYRLEDGVYYEYFYKPEGFQSKEVGMRVLYGLDVFRAMKDYDGVGHPVNPELQYLIRLESNVAYIKYTPEEITRELCVERSITPNGLSYIAGVPQATIKSILNGETKSPEVVTVKKLCDGFQITLAQFFDTAAFNSLEQEIQ